VGSVISLKITNTFSDYVIAEYFTKTSKITPLILLCRFSVNKVFYTVPCVIFTQNKQINSGCTVAYRMCLNVFNGRVPSPSSSIQRKDNEGEREAKGRKHAEGNR